MAALACAIAPVVHAQATREPIRLAADAGVVTPIDHWQIQDSAKAQQSGADISLPGYSTKEWYTVSGCATVMAGLLEN
jgi:exo-1,4-beta-D-glucosaminidase